MKVLFFIFFSICFTDSDKVPCDYKAKNDYVVKNYKKYKKNFFSPRKKIFSVDLENSTINGKKIKSQKNIKFYKHKYTHPLRLYSRWSLILGSVGIAAVVIDPNGAAGQGYIIAGFITGSLIGATLGLYNQVSYIDYFTLDELNYIDCK